MLNRCLLFGCCLALLSCAYAQQTCTVETDNGYYDLNPLSSKTDYNVKATDNREYKINVCQPLNSEVWNPEGVSDAKAIGAMYKGARGDQSIGDYNTTVTFEHSNPVLIYHGGSPCDADTKLRASTAIRFLCDRSVFDSGTPVLVASLPPDVEKPCAFFFEWRTSLACPSARRTSLGSFMKFLLITAVVLILILIAIPIAYRRFFLQHRGRDMLPSLPSQGLSNALQSIIDYLRGTPDRFRKFAPSSNGRSFGFPGRQNWNHQARAHYESLSAEEEYAPLHPGNSGPDNPFTVDDEDEDVPTPTGTPKPDQQQYRVTGQNGFAANLEEFGAFEGP